MKARIDIIMRITLDILYFYVRFESSKQEVNQMKKESKATIGIILLLVTIVVIAGMVRDHIDSRKAEKFPEGNFTILSWNEDFLRKGGDLIVFHDDDLNITCLVYKRYTEAGLWGCPDWQLTPPQNMSRNYNCS